MFYVAAQVVKAAPSHLYDYAVHYRIEKQMFPRLSDANVQLYTHPPFELLVYLPLTIVSYLEASYVWIAISVGLALLCARILAQSLPRNAKKWWPAPYAIILCLFPFYYLLLQEQDSVLALVLLTLCWTNLQRGDDFAAGVLLGIALFKFPIVVPLALLLLIWRLRLWSGLLAGSVVTALISLAMVGPAGLLSYGKYLFAMGRASSAVASKQFQVDPAAMPSIRGFIVGSGIFDRWPPTFTLLAQLLAGALLLAWAGRRIRKEKDARFAFSLALIVGLLLSFHLLMHDLVLLALPVWLTLDELVHKPHLGGANTAFVSCVAVFYATPLFFFINQDRNFFLSVPLLAMAVCMQSQAADVPGRYDGVQS